MNSKIKLLFVFIWVLSMNIVNAQELYVSTDGNDGNSGTISSPLASIQAAINKASAGSTIFIREGVYHEEVVTNNLKGTENKPVIIKAYNKETVIVDGSVNLNEIKQSGSNWELATDAFPGTTNIYKLQLNENIWQLFVKQPEFMHKPNAVNGELADYRMQVIARWPNSSNNPCDPVIRKGDSPEAADETWWSFTTTWASAAGQENDHYTLNNNSERFDLAGANMSFEGGTAIVSAVRQGPGNLVVEITEHAAGSNTIKHSGLPENEEIYAQKSNHGPSYFIQHLNALDKEGEWYFDKDSKTVYLWPEGNANPNDLEIRGKNQTYAFTLTDCEYITFDGIALFATSLNLKGTKISYTNGAISYPDMPQTLLGNLPGITQAVIAPKCSYLSFVNNVVEYSIGQLINPYKEGAYFDNNYLHHLGMYGIGESGCLENMNTFINNTLEAIGQRAAVKTNSGPEEGRNQSWNMLSGWGFLYANDGVGFQSNQSGSVNSIRSYMWFIRSNKPGHRYDGPDEGLGFPTLGLSHHLVGYKTTSVSTNIKGDYNEVYNYLGIKSTSDKGDIAIRFNRDTGEGNKNTIMRNCAADGINLTKWVPIPCIHSNNWDASKDGGSMSEFHPNAPIFDFRPKTDAPTVNAGYIIPGITDGYLGDAPDIGAYEYGDDTYWIPGYKAAKTSFPIPQDGLKGMTIDRDLIFRHAYKSDSAIVYFSSDKDAVKNATSATAYNAGTVELNNGEVIVITLGKGRNIVTPTMLLGNPNNYDPEPYLLIDDETQLLPSHTTFYWRVDAINKDGSVIKGEVWSFKTGNSLVLDLSKESNDYSKDNGSIKLYPNPVNNRLNINSIDTVNWYEIYDAQGRKVKSKTEISNTNAIIDLPEMESGIYYIKLSGNAFVHTARFIKG